MNKILKWLQSFRKQDDVLYEMTDQEFIDFHNKFLADIPKWIVKKSIEVLQKEFSEDDIKLIREKYREDPVYWISPYHFHWGMRIRNLLRREVCQDKELSKDESLQNWDNGYTQMIEIAAGVRKYE